MWIQGINITSRSQQGPDQRLMCRFEENITNYVAPASNLQTREQGRAATSVYDGIAESLRIGTGDSVPAPPLLQGDLRKRCPERAVELHPLP